MASSKKATAAKPLPAHHGGPTEPEKLDTTPVEMPLGYAKPTPISELIARAVHEQIQAQSEEEHETFEEANDFEPEDPDVLDFSAYEIHEGLDELPAGVEEPTGEDADPLLDLAGIDPKIPEDEPQPESGAE